MYVKQQKKIYVDGKNICGWKKYMWMKEKIYMNKCEEVYLDQRENIHGDCGEYIWTKCM